MPIRQRLPRTVLILGFVSFFNDLSSEMVVPLIPILLAAVLGAGPVALGVIEGVAEAVASLLKLWAGRHSDRLNGRRKGLALFGYSLSNAVRPLLGLAASWPMIALLRGVDRVGKGVRSAPRDALVADATPPALMGFAYGYHRALDNGGAVLGSLTAAAVLAFSPARVSHVILWSALPGLAAVLLLAFGVKSPTIAAARQPVLPPLRWSALSSPMRRYLQVLALFTFARVSETFILLRGYALGITPPHLLLLWAALNAAKAATATGGGRLADRIGRERVMLTSWIAYSAAFLLLGQVGHGVGLWAVTLGYGLFAGLSEGAERALISGFAAGNERGTAFGWYHLLVGLAAVPAGLLFGAVWHYEGAEAAFTLAGVIAGVSAALLRLRAWPPAAHAVHEG